MASRISRACTEFEVNHARLEASRAKVLAGLKEWIAESSQTEVAKQLDFSVPYIHDVINGRRAVSLVLIDHLKIHNPGRKVVR